MINDVEIYISEVTLKTESKMPISSVLSVRLAGSNSDTGTQPAIIVRGDTGGGLCEECGGWGRPVRCAECLRVCG